MASLFVILIYSIYRCKSEKKQIKLELKVDDWVVTEGDTVNIRLKIHGIRSKKNKYTFSVGYEIETNYREYRQRKKKKLIWDPKTSDSIILSEKIKECDSYHIRFTSIAWEDLTGIYKVKKKLDQATSLLAMPKRYEMGTMNEKIARKKLIEQGFEYDGVRQYRDGDRISRVHWNLYASTGQLWVRKNEEEEEENIRIGLSLQEIPKDRISDYLCIFYSVSFFLLTQGITQEICYGEQTFSLSHIEQYEELFTDIFGEKNEVLQYERKEVYEIPLCDKEMDLEKFLYDMEL